MSQNLKAIPFDREFQLPCLAGLHGLYDVLDHGAGVAKRMDKAIPTIKWSTEKESGTKPEDEDSDGQTASPSSSEVIVADRVASEMAEGVD